MNTYPFVSGLRHSLLLTTCSAAGLLLVLPSAAAQHNSLLGRRSGQAAPAPTSQPAGNGDTAAPSNGSGNGNGSAPNPRTIRPPKAGNITLLRLSPFAVEAPSPEQIKVHDQITIIIRESKTATTDSKMESKKDWSLDTALDKWIRYSNLHGIVPAKFEEGNPAILFNYNNDYKTDGKYDRTDELTTRIQATVIDVKPNGTLMLEAKKAISIDEEGYTIRLTGDCRAKDVTPQNTVLSTQVANLDVDVKHTGAVRDATRRGWFMRALDFIRPF